MFCKSLLLQLFLIKFVLSIPTIDFFINGNIANDIKVTSTEAILSFSPNIGLGCGAVRSLKVSIFVILLSSTCDFC